MAVPPGKTGTTAPRQVTQTVSLLLSRL